LKTIPCRRIGLLDAADLRPAAVEKRDRPGAYARGVNVSIGKVERIYIANKGRVQGSESAGLIGQYGSCYAALAA
jgi:hypothetical protein